MAVAAKKTPDVPITTDKPLDYVKAVAAANGIDWQTLWGVFGTESNYGQDPAANTPNRVGALGPFQFLSGTWLKYGTANPNDRRNFGHSVNAAARYLRALGADGDVNSQATAHALNAYSGGGGAGYIANVRKKGGDTQDRPVFDVPGAGRIDPKKTLNTIEDAAKVPGEFLKLVTDPKTWLRLVEIVVGAALLLMGLKSFTGGEVDPLGAAGRVARMA